MAVATSMHLELATTSPSRRSRGPLLDKLLDVYIYIFIYRYMHTLYMCVYTLSVSSHIYQMHTYTYVSISVCVYICIHSVFSYVHMYSCLLFVSSGSRRRMELPGWRLGSRSRLPPDDQRFRGLRAYVYAYMLDTCTHACT